MNQLENCQARYRSNIWMGRTSTDGPDEFEPSKFDCIIVKVTADKHLNRRNLKVSWIFYLIRPPDKRAYWKIIFFISHPKHVVGTQKNRLNETVLLSTQNTCLNKWVRK